MKSVDISDPEFKYDPEGPEGKEEVETQRLVFFPKGREGAHQVRSDKIAIWTGGDRADDAVLPRGVKVGYFEGEV